MNIEDIKPGMWVRSKHTAHGLVTRIGPRRPDGQRVWMLTRRGAEVWNTAEYLEPSTPPSFPLTEAHRAVLADARKQDPAVTELVEKAYAIAERRGYCGQFKEVMDELGLERPKKMYRVSLGIVNVKAASKDEARRLMYSEHKLAPGVILGVREA